MLASIIFRRDPFFRGADNRDQLVKIAQVLGTDLMDSWVNKYGLYIGKQYYFLLMFCSNFKYLNNISFRCRMYERFFLFLNYILIKF